MKKTVFFLTLLMVSALSFAQQSNKSKSKDRYREKESPSRAAVEQQVEQWAPLRRLAEEQLPEVLESLTLAAGMSNLSPAATSQCYAYALIAAYETTARYTTRVPSLRGAISDMPPALSFAPKDSVFYPLAALLAALEVGKTLTSAGHVLQEHQDNLAALFSERGLPPSQIAHSRKAAQDIAQVIARFAQSGASGRLLLLPAGEPLGWGNPTPEDYTEGSRYRMFVREVYERGGTNASWEHKAQVEAWVSSRPLSVAWMSLSMAACIQQGLSFNPTLRALALTSIAMADAYSVCTSEVRQYARSTPREAVNRLHDSNWQPLVPETAPDACAREYGLVSAAAAAALTHTLGERLTFQAGERVYNSFREAAREATMARFYAGYQLRDVLEAGLVSGERLGSAVVQRWPKEQ